MLEEFSEFVMAMENKLNLRQDRHVGDDYTFESAKDHLIKELKEFAKAQTDEEKCTELVDIANCSYALWRVLKR